MPTKFGFQQSGLATDVCEYNPRFEIDIKKLKSITMISMHVKKKIPSNTSLYQISHLLHIIK